MQRAAFNESRLWIADDQRVGFAIVLLVLTVFPTEEN